MTDHAAHPPAKVAATDNSEGMSYLESLPSKILTLYIPLFIIVVILLFPFYWMALTSIKPDEQLIDMDTFNPFWVVDPTLKHIKKRCTWQQPRRSYRSLRA
jgi:multiple sugar transport system permease protein